MILQKNDDAAMKKPARPSRPTSGLSSIYREMIIPRSQEETFAFFSDARNLDILTPRWVGFKILTPTPIEMRAGALIEYQIRIHGIPIRWRTEITEWEAPHRFVDVQLKGPYQWWHHEHRFESCTEGTRVIDEVEFRAPLHWISHPLMVKRDVRRIFDYRAHALERLFGGANAS